MSPKLFVSLLLALQALAACATTSHQKGDGGVNSEPIDSEVVNDTTVDESSIGGENQPAEPPEWAQPLKGVLMAHDRQHGTDFKNTFIETITAKKALKLLRIDAAFDAEEGDLRRIAAEVLDGVEASTVAAAIARVDGSEAFPDVFMFVPVSPEAGSKYGINTGGIALFVDLKKESDQSNDGSLNESIWGEYEYSDWKGKAHVIVFGSTSCGNAAVLRKNLEKMSEKPLPLAFVDGGEEDKLLRKYSPISAVPIMAAVNDAGEHVDLLIGDGADIASLQRFFHRNGFLEKGPSLALSFRSMEKEKNLWILVGRDHYVQGEDLSGLNLRNVKLFKGSLSGSSLRNADLSGADLRHAILSRADFTGADLSDANLEGAFFYDTVCPDGTRTFGKPCRLHQ